MTFSAIVELSWTFVRFGAVGATVTLLNVVILVLWLNAGLHYLTATILSWIPSVILGFVLNRSQTFRLRSTISLREILEYTGAALLQLAMAITGLAILIDGLSLHWFPACIINVAVVSICNFFVLRQVVFRQSLMSSR
jgi:putative flippase GtrA